MLMLSRGSAYEIAFAAQMHENRGRVPRFSYFQREKVSARELSDVRVLRSQNTDCRKNEVFRQSQIPTHQESVFFERVVRVYPSETTRNYVNRVVFELLQYVKTCSDPIERLVQHFIEYLLQTIHYTR